MRKSEIYALIDPITSEIKYIGRSVDVKNRILLHMNCRVNIEKYNWLRALVNNKLKPIVRILCECALNEDAHEIETRIIFEFLNSGYNLFNIVTPSTTHRMFNS